MNDVYAVRAPTRITNERPLLCFYNFYTQENIAQTSLSIPDYRNARYGNQQHGGR